jgi:hypothetical protein
VALRDRSDGGVPAASGVEVLLVAEALGTAVAPVPYAGVLLAADLLGLAGAHDWAAEAAEAGTRTTVLLDASLGGLAPADDLDGAVAFDADGATYGVALRGEGDGARVVRVRLGAGAVPVEPTDLSRTLLRLRDAGGVELEEAPQPLRGEDLTRWTCLALVVLCADLAGVMRGTLDRAVEYAKERIQYDAPIGSFQAIQHLLAEMLVRTEATITTARYAAWAVDELDPDEALAAAQTAKAYASVAAREVCEGSMQVFGGIGQTWEHPAHLYTRRAVLGCVVLGDEAHHLDRLADRSLAKLEG